MVTHTHTANKGSLTSMARGGLLQLPPQSCHVNNTLPGVLCGPVHAAFRVQLHVLKTPRVSFADSSCPCAHASHGGACPSTRSTTIADRRVGGSFLPRSRVSNTVSSCRVLGHTCDTSRHAEERGRQGGVRRRQCSVAPHTTYQDCPPSYRYQVWQRSRLLSCRPTEHFLLCAQHTSTQH